MEREGNVGAGRVAHQAERTAGENQSQQQVHNTNDLVLIYEEFKSGKMEHYRRS